MSKEDVAARVFDIGSQVRYVAIQDHEGLHLATREGLVAASSSESDRYEELLVNPTLVTMTRQRGNIDCGGLDFVLVGYGNFSQLVVPTATGHVSVALENEAVAVDGLAEIIDIVTARLP